MQIRGYRAGDYKAMHRLRVQCDPGWGDYDLEDLLRSTVERKPAIVVIAERGPQNEMVGFVVLHLREPGTRMFSDVSFPEKYADIQFLDVQPNARRSGIATLILTDAEAQARAAGARSIMSEIREKETGKAQFFERLKYVKAGYEVDAYGPSRDGLIRTKQL